MPVCFLPGRTGRRATGVWAGRGGMERSNPGARGGGGLGGWAGSHARLPRNLFPRVLYYCKRVPLDLSVRTLCFTARTGGRTSARASGWGKAARRARRGVAVGWLVGAGEARAGAEDRGSKRGKNKIKIESGNTRHESCSSFSVLEWPLERTTAAPPAPAGPTQALSETMDILGVCVCIIGGVLRGRGWGGGTFCS